MGKNKKLVKLILAMAVSAALTMPASAEPGTETTDVQENVTGASVENANDFIVFLPTEDGVEYSYDSAHMAETYSTSDYTVLLYNPGETVSFQVTSDKGFTIEDVLQGTEYTDVSILDNGVVTFTMPEIDLCCDFSDTEDTSEGETETNESGTFRIRLSASLNGTCTMVNSADVNLNDGEEYKGNDMVDLIRVKSDNGLDEEPEVTVFKNGEKVEDASGIVINKGLSGGTFVVDFKNALPIETDSYVVRIQKNGDALLSDDINGESEAKTADAFSADGTVISNSDETDLEQSSYTEQGMTEAGVQEAVGSQMSDTGTSDADSTGIDMYDFLENYSDDIGGIAAASDTGNTKAEMNVTEETNKSDLSDTDVSELEGIGASAAETADTGTTNETGAVQSIDEGNSDISGIMVTDMSGITNASETMTELGTVNDGYQGDAAVSSVVAQFTDTVRDTAKAVNITITNNVPQLPLVVKKTDGKIETADSVYVTADGILQIEFIGDVLYAPQITVLKEDEEMNGTDSIIEEKKYLENGNLFLKIKPEDEIDAGNYEIRIG